MKNCTVRAKKQINTRLLSIQYNPAGKLEGETRGTPSGPFSKPESLAVNSSGDLLVADRSASGVIGSPGAVDVFGASVLVPATSVQAPSGVNPTTVVLNGSVNPAGLEVTSCEFEYGTGATHVFRSCPANRR